MTSRRGSQLRQLSEDRPSEPGDVVDTKGGHCRHDEPAWTAPAPDLSVRGRVRQTGLMQRDRKSRRLALDVATIAAAGVVAYALVATVHEAVGHGAACLAVGADASAVSSTELRCDGVSGTSALVVTSSGSVANVLVGLGAFGLFRVARPGDGRTLLLGWLVCAWNLFHAGSYLLTGALFGFGDWGRVAGAVHPPILGQIGVGLVGAAIIFLGQRVATDPLWQPLVGIGDDRAARWPRITWPALAAGVAVSLLAGVLSPLRPEFALLTSVLAPLSLLWLVRLPRWPTADNPREAVPIRRSAPLLGISLLVSVIFVLMLGPGIGSFAGYSISR